MDYYISLKCDQTKKYKEQFQLNLIKFQSVINYIKLKIKKKINETKKNMYLLFLNSIDDIVFSRIFLILKLIVILLLQSELNFYKLNKTVQLFVHLMYNLIQ